MFSYPAPEEYAALQESGLFLDDWYAASYATKIPPGADALMDFCTRGWGQGFWPSPYFDTPYYLDTNPDVAAEKINPLLHYLRQGDAKDSKPIEFFDPAWYRAAQGLTEFENTLAHFLRHRFGGRASPMASFDPARTLRLHPHLVAKRIDPFLYARQHEADPQPSDEEIAALSGLFDATYYLLVNPDVRERALAPLKHFQAYGWRENRDPNLYFDTDFYVARLKTPMAGETPLTDYFLRGEIAGDPPGPHFDAVWYAENYNLEPAQSALRHFLENRRSQGFSPNPRFDVAEYVARFGGALGRNRDPYMHFLRHGGAGQVPEMPSS